MKLHQNYIVEQETLSHQKQVFEIVVVGNATPSSKQHATDLPGICVLASEGKTADLAAVEDITGQANYVAPSDSLGKVNVLLKAGGTSAPTVDLGVIKKVMKITAYEKDSIGTLRDILPLGNAYNFALLAASTITDAGASVITGDLGLSPGTSVTGFPPATVSGTQHIADSAAAAAQVAALAAYNDLAGRTVTANLTGQDLGSMTLTPGVYKFDVSAQLTGTLTLDGQGDPNALFIFQIGSTLTTASSSVITLTNGAVAGNVFFQVGSSATLGSSTDFSGNIIALASITLVTSAAVDGRLMALTGAITLDGNVVSTVAIPAVGSGGFTLAPCTAIGVVGGLTAAGNVAFSVDTSLNFATGAGGTIAIELDYML